MSKGTATCGLEDIIIIDMRNIHLIVSAATMIIRLTVRHNFLRNQFIDIRFDDALTIKQVKTKIYNMTGTTQKNQKLLLKRSDTDIIMLSDKSTLRDYGC